MTILKKILLSLAIAPLAMPMAFAINSGGGAGKATFKEFTMKESVVTPTISKERRVIKRQTIKPLAQVNPNKPMMEEKETYHDEKKSECWLLAQNNIACAERHEADE